LTLAGLVGGILALLASQAQRAVIKADRSAAARSQPYGTRGHPNWRVDIDPGAAFPRHKRQGQEIIYVIEGLIEYDLEGKPPVTLKAGDVLFVPAETIHAAKNVGSVNAAEWGTYAVEKDKPLVELAK
jgi:quercetin dioxygenase-like cupin family protein